MFVSRTRGAWWHRMLYKRGRTTICAVPAWRCIRKRWARHSLACRLRMPLSKWTWKIKPCSNEQTHTHKKKKKWKEIPSNGSPGVLVKNGFTLFISYEMKKKKNQLVLKSKSRLVNLFFYRRFFYRSIFYESRKSLF